MKSVNKSSKETKSDLKKSIECGQILADFYYADYESDAEVRNILFRGTKPFRSKLPNSFTKRSILLPDNAYYPQLELINILKYLKNRKDPNRNADIRFYINSYNSFFDKDGNLKKNRSTKIKDLSWYHVIAYNLVHFIKLNNYSKYIRRSPGCGRYQITEKELKLPV